jgi:DNA repair protein RadD
MRVKMLKLSIGAEMFKPRPHQIDAFNKLRFSISSGHKRPILFAPCAFGKTILGAMVAESAWNKGNKTLFIVHRRMLADQTKEKFDAYGLHSSIIMAGYDTDFSAPVMITTHQTYTRRLQLCAPEANKFFHDAACLIVDECHMGISPSYKKIYDFYNDRIVIGLTGSPARGDQRGLGEIFDDLVESIGIHKLTEQGYLTPARYFAPTRIDLSDVKITAGDYNRRALQAKMNTKKLNGDVLQSWLQHAEGRSTIIFTTGVKHSKALRDQFAFHGVSVAHLDAHSSDDERERVLRQFRDGDITVVTNCQLFTEGYDADFASCIVLARGTKSFPLFTQMCGRGQRTYPGKKDFIVLDHGSNIERFGFISDPVEWSLDGKKIAWKKPKKIKKEPKIMQCPMCSAVFKAAPKCPDCCHPIKECNMLVESTDDELKEIGGSKKKFTMDEKRLWFGMFEYLRRQKGYNPGWTSHKYREKVGVWPKGMDNVGPIPPNDECKNWMKHLAIKWNKMKNKQKQDQQCATI